MKINKKQTTILCITTATTILLIILLLFSLPSCTNNTATPDEATADTATSDTVSTTQNVTAETTVPVPTTAKEKAIAELKVDEKGNVVDADGNKVEVKNGKVEVKDENGKTVEVTVEEIKESNSSNNSNSNNSSKSSSTSKSNASSSANKKPASNNTNSNSNNSSNNSSSSVNQKTYHEAVYKTVNHPAETKKIKVIDQESSSYEEPIYEEKGVALCNDCNADITDENIGWHCADHLENGGKGSYRVEVVEVQVGTKTVTIPEKSHYETVITKEAWTEKVLVREAGWY